MEEGADMHSLLMTDNNTLIMGGLQNYVVEVDLNTVQETQKVRRFDYIYQNPQQPLPIPVGHMIKLTSEWVFDCLVFASSSLLKYLEWQ